MADLGAALERVEATPFSTSARAAGGDRPRQAVELAARMHREIVRRLVRAARFSSAGRAASQKLWPLEKRGWIVTIREQGSLRVQSSGRWWECRLNGSQFGHRGWSASTGRLADGHNVDKIFRLVDSAVTDFLAEKGISRP